MKKLCYVWQLDVLLPILSGETCERGSHTSTAAVGWGPPRPRRSVLSTATCSARFTLTVRCSGLRSFRRSAFFLCALGVSPFFRLLPASFQRAAVSPWSLLGDELAGSLRSVTPSWADIAPTLGLGPRTGAQGPVSSRRAPQGPAAQLRVCPGERRLRRGAGADGGPGASANEGEVSPVQEAGPLGLGKAPLAVERRGSGGQLLREKPLRDPLLEIIRRKVIIV